MFALIKLAGPTTRRAALASAIVLALALPGGCPGGGTVIDGGQTANMTDKTNGGASFVGASACKQCHSDYADAHSRTAHAFALRQIRGGAPATPSFNPRASVPDPPPGLAWSDVSYIIDGFAKSAAFLDRDGNLVTAADGRETHWLLDTPINGNPPAFVGVGQAGATPKPFAFAELSKRTTGPLAVDPADPMFQDNREGIQGTWSEPGVQCEACHGPASGHFTSRLAQVTIDRSRIFVDPDSSQTCIACHSRSTTGDILVADGFLLDQQQGAELKASGGHAAFACTICHNPHRSLQADRELAIRNQCTACHVDATMAGHRNKVLRIGDYVEQLRCESCHMPPATRTASSAAPAFTGGSGHVGDTRTHIFRINTDQSRPIGFFTADGSKVARDAAGRAAVSADYVCLRCHNGVGAFALTPARAAEIAPNVHRLPETD